MVTHRKRLCTHRRCFVRFPGGSLESSGVWWVMIAWKAPTFSEPGCSGCSIHKSFHVGVRLL